MAPLTAALVLAAGSVVVTGALVIAGSWLGVRGLAAPAFGGLIGPLVAVMATWLAVARAYRRDPAGVMAVTLRAFMWKVGFFVVYVTAAIRVAGLPGRAFAVSFVAWFIVLYAAQVVLVGRLFREGVKGV